MSRELIKRQTAKPNEIEIYEKFANSEIVQKLAQLIKGEIKCADNTAKSAVKYLLSLEKEALREAGILFNEQGQMEFADAIFFDVLMSPKDKIFWLEQPLDNGQTDDSQKARIEYLKTK